MDINQYSEQYIKFASDHFLNSLTSQISSRIVNNVSELVNQFDVQGEINKQISQVVGHAISSYQTSDISGAQAVGLNMVEDLKSHSQQYIDKLAADIRERVITDFHNKVNNLDIGSLVREQCNVIVSAAVKNNTLNFLDNSIPARAINTDGLKIKADDILPGTVKNFSSTGIEDLSSRCQLTLTDNFSIFENKLITQDFEVKGYFKISGPIDPKLSHNIADLAVQKIEQTYSDGTFDQYVHRVIDKIDKDGIDSTKVLVQGRPIVENSSLAQTITVSNLRKVGLLSELEVAGEVLFDDTLYVRSGKVGINTIEPEYILDAWDQEVQLVAFKKQRDTAYIGTVKNQNLVLGTAGSDQLVLSSNGDITVEKIQIGRNTHTSGSFQPSENRQMGTIVWNEQPQVGQPIGWVSLGGSRWAQFGIITE